MRSRNIKPGFFLNEELADIEPPWGRILFAGLWCMADKKGRLEDRPRRMKAEIFPYDEKLPSIEKILVQLSLKAFILRYSVNGEKFIQINKFKDHQHPHNTERESTIPEPLINGDLTVDPQLPNGGNRADSLIHGFTDSLNHDLSIPEKDFATPAPGNGDVRPQPPAFSCECFEIVPKYLEELAAKFPLLPSEYLIKEFFPRMRDWCLDNRKNPKHVKKFDARGRLKSPRGCFSNWLKKEDPERAVGYIPTSPPTDIPPEDTDGILVPLSGCPECGGKGIARASPGSAVKYQPCTCLHPINEVKNAPSEATTTPQ